MQVNYAVRRRLMRSTWLSTSYIWQQLGLKSKILFVIGTTESQNIQSDIAKESERHKDIIQANFIDSYENNTYKAMTYLL